MPNRSESSLPEFLTIQEIASRFRVSKMTVYRWYHGGQVEGVRVGRLIRVKASSVEALLGGQREN